MIKNRTQLQKASDEEIEQFFSETIFEGIFSTEIKSKNTDFYKGSISDIKLNSRPTNIVMAFLNVPRTSNPIPEGPCSFKCRMNIAAFREDLTKYSVNLVGGSLQSTDATSEPKVTSSTRDYGEQDLFDMWGVDSCESIGYYHYDEESEVYIIDDLRKPNFDHIPYYPEDKEKRPIRISYPYEIKGIQLNDYYLFTWKLSRRNRYNPYEIFIDFKTQPRTIDPKWFIDTLFDDRHNDKSKNFGSATNFLDTLSKQLSAKESTFIYELLQNANDYPVEGLGVDIEFHITENYLLFLHSGDKFNVRNISGICGINEKEKVANKKAIGYKGIGFKTVFLNNHYVYLKTGKYSFRFEEKAEKIRRLEAPWPILPIWTEYGNVPQEVNSIFDKIDKKYQVQIALRPNSKSLLHVGAKSYENLFKQVFADSNIILFIPNINSVRVLINGQEECVCFRNNEKWIVGDYEEEIPFELQEIINKTIDKGNSRIPEKYQDFDCTKVSFACMHDGVMIKPVNKATLYCYLPTKASWGFPFLMNTDMIPKGDRNDIETEVKLLDGDDTNFNEELAGIAGSKLFDWIKDLLTSKRYHLGSVFSLIPDFEQCKKKHDYYENFIEHFEELFDSRVENDLIVPVSKGIANVKRMVLDTTEISSSGIITDDEFQKFTEMEDYYLPLPILRKDKNFNSFLKRYADDEQKFKVENLTNLIGNEDFQVWLKAQENNNKFLNFLLDRGYLEDLLEEEIFLEADGELYKASELYYDIDEYLVDLQTFTNHICYISPKTREYFKENKKWENVISNAFDTFDCDKFVDNILLSDKNKTDSIEKLKDKDTSIHFFKFVAENVEYLDKYKSLPFLNDSNKFVENFEDRIIFISSINGHTVCNSKWMSSIEVEFLSNEYTDVTKKYFKDNFGLQDFSDEFIIKNVIVNEDYSDSVSDSINEDFDANKAFIDYCYAHEDLLKSGDLRNYSLLVYDGDENEQWCLAEDHIFFQSDLYDALSSREWIDSDWMYVLDEDYIEGVTDKTGYKKFLSSKFCIDELTAKKFYTDIVKKNIKDIVKNTSEDADSEGKKNIDFVKYLDDNYDLIFIEKKDSDIFSEFVLVSTNITDLSLEDRVYIYDEELVEVIENGWFPKDTVFLCNKEYGKSRALLAIGCKFYKFGEFYDEIIVDELDTINKNINSKEISISFHSFIIEHLGSLTTDQQSKMAKAKVFLYGNDNVSATSSGHKILSVKAKELFNKGLVEFSDLDIIDPDYKIEENSEYWETRLGNTKFTISHFFLWLKENTDTFSSTLQNKDLNIEFWRWLKENVSDKYIEEIPILPVLLKGGTIDNGSETVYFSDEYLKGGGIEHSVKRFDKDGLFLSPDYIDENDGVEEWKAFWIKIGVKYEVVDILFDTIIPNLPDIDDESLPKLIAENRETLEKKYESGLIPQLINLRVKAHDGEFYAINETIYIDCEKNEPFPYIELPNQISFNTSEERRLIKDIFNEIDCDCVSILSEWQQRKLYCYLAMQSEDSESVREFHYQFIDDLSTIKNTERESLKEIEQIEKIYLLNKDNEFCNASTLTMGSIYKPFFDFESCNIDSLDYVSNSYNSECSEYTGKLFRALHIHCDFLEDDIDFLTDRECSLYFWGKYLTKKDVSITRIKEFISDSLFDELACIPTKDNIKMPDELYRGSEVSRYIKAVEDWENKVPLKNLSEIKQSNGTSIFDELPFKDSLDFLDALYALVTIAGQDRRTRLLEWMIEDYDVFYDAKILEYREDKHALWYNNKNERVQIKELYALDYSDKTIEQYFGANHRIVNKAYFPAGDSFEKACNILGIKIITSDDLKMEPIGDSIFTDRDKDLKLFALIIAGMIDKDDWQSLYSGYCEKLEILTLHKCTSIMIIYNEDESINQSLRKFYHNKDSNDFYFVDSLDGKRVYTLFVKEYTEYLDINEDDITQELVEDIMDSSKNALEIIKEQNTLMLDEAFKDEMEKIIPGIKCELSGNAAEVDDEQGIDILPSFSTTQHDVESNDVFEEKNGLSKSDTSNNSVGKVHVREHERNYPGSGDVSNNNGINPVLTQININKDDSVDININTASSIPIGTNQQKSNIPQGDYSQMESDEDYDSEEETDNEYEEASIDTVPENDYMGSVDKDEDYQPIDSNPYKPHVRKHPKPFTQDELNRLRSNGSPLELESLPATEEEIDLLTQCGISSEQIADTNYLAQLRLYMNLKNERDEEPIESMEEFVRNADDVTSHALKGGRYIHSCSAARGIMYISPSVWEQIVDNKWAICVYLDGRGKNFHYINNADEFLKLIEKDDVVIKITGKEKVKVVNELYSGLLKKAKGTAYTLVRVAARTNMDAVFAHYIGAMAEIEDGNEDDNDY